jgi:cytolysin (calcineurin-like family phosphatase)
MEAGATSTNTFVVLIVSDTEARWTSTDTFVVFIVSEHGCIKRAIVIDVKVPTTGVSPVQVPGSVGGTLCST